MYNHTERKKINPMKHDIFEWEWNREKKEHQIYS